MFDWIKQVNASGASTGARALALALLQFFGPEMFCWPSQETLAELLGVKTRSIRRWIFELENLGLIDRDRTKIQATIRAKTGHTRPKTGHRCPKSEEPNRTQVSSDRTDVSQNRTQVSYSENTEPDTGVLNQDTPVLNQDTGVLKNYPNELPNELSQCVPRTHARAPESPPPGSALDSDDQTDDEAMYLLAVFHELRKHSVTPEQCVVLVRDARELGANAAELEAEIRGICERLRMATAPKVMRMALENLRNSKSDREKVRAAKQSFLGVGRNTYQEPAETETKVVYDPDAIPF